MDSGSYHQCVFLIFPDFILSAMLFVIYILYFPSESSSQVFIQSLHNNTARQPTAGENGPEGSLNVVWANFLKILRYHFTLQGV